MTPPAKEGTSSNSSCGTKDLNSDKGEVGGSSPPRPNRRGPFGVENQDDYRPSCTGRRFHQISAETRPSDWFIRSCVGNRVALQLGCRYSPRMIVRLLLLSSLLAARTLILNVHYVHDHHWYPFFYNTWLSKHSAGPVLGAIVRPLRPVTSLDIVL